MLKPDDTGAFRATCDKPGCAEVFSTVIWQREKAIAAARQAGWEVQVGASSQPDRHPQCYCPTHKRAHQAPTPVPPRLLAGTPYELELQYRESWHDGGEVYEISWRGSVVGQLFVKHGEYVFLAEPGWNLKHQVFVPLETIAQGIETALRARGW